MIKSYILFHSWKAYQSDDVQIDVFCSQLIQKMSEQSPKFNEIFVQPTPTKITDYKFDIDRGQSDVRELPQDIDRKLIGFQSIDELLEGIPHQKMENQFPNPYKVVQENRKIPQNKKPIITIKYSQPEHTRNKIFFSFKPVRSPEMRVRKVIQYEERVVRVPVEKQIMEYGYIIQQNFQPSETQLQEKMDTFNNFHMNKALSPLSKQVPPINTNQSKSKQARQHLMNDNRLQRRYVTSDDYNYLGRRQQLQHMISKIDGVKQIEWQLFSK